MVRQNVHDNSEDCMTEASYEKIGKKGASCFSYSSLHKVYYSGVNIAPWVKNSACRRPSFSFISSKFPEDMERKEVRDRKKRLNKGERDPSPP